MPDLLDFICHAVGSDEAKNACAGCRCSSLRSLLTNCRFRIETHAATDDNDASVLRAIQPLERQTMTSTHPTIAQMVARQLQPSACVRSLRREFPGWDRGQPLLPQGWRMNFDRELRQYGLLAAQIL